MLDPLSLSLVYSIVASLDLFMYEYASNASCFT